jgi:hypothetical protein
VLDSDNQIPQHGATGTHGGTTKSLFLKVIGAAKNKEPNADMMEKLRPVIQNSWGPFSVETSNNPAIPASLESQENFGITEATPDQSVNPASLNSEEELELHDQVIEETALEHDTSMYTSLLYEEGQSQNAVPTYTESRIRNHPPWFRTSVTFQNVTGSGEGQSKKAAKHLASRDACAQLNLSLPLSSTA